MSNDLPRKRPTGAPHRQWRRPVAEEHINHYPPLIASAIAASVSVVIGYILTLGFVMAAWLFAAHGSESTLQVLRATGIAWQVLHLVPIVIGTTTVGVLPWGFLALPILILWKATHWALKSAQPKTAVEFVRVAVLTSAIYSACAGIVGLVSSTADLHTAFLSVILHSLFVSLAVSTACILTFAPSRTILTDRLPKLFKAGVRPAVLSFGLLFVAASALTSISLILNWAQLRAVTMLMAPGFIDGFFMTLLGIGYLPTINVWTMSYLLGPGVVIGGGVVTPESANPGALPAFPLLSILPSEAVPLAALFVLVPILLGVVIYLLMPRERWSAQGNTLASSLSLVLRWSEVSIVLISTSLLALFVWIAATLSSGSLGNGNLDFIGPVPSKMAFAAFSVCGLSALMCLVLPRTVMTLIHYRSIREDLTK